MFNFTFFKMFSDSISYYFQNRRALNFLNQGFQLFLYRKFPPNIDIYRLFITQYIILHAQYFYL